MYTFQALSGRLGYDLGLNDRPVEDGLQNWVVYIIEASDDSLYTGITTDIERRWLEHHGGGKGARFFRGRSPRRLAYLETSADRASASRREFEIKQLSRKQKQMLIQSGDNLLGEYRIQTGEPSVE